MFKTIFLPLTIRLEAFTHLVPVPFAIYLASITQEYSASEWLLFLFICVTSGTFMVLGGCLWRYLILKKISIQFETLQLEKRTDSYTIGSNQKAKELKLFLYRYPFYEGFIIILRWFVGVGLIFLVTPFFDLYRPTLWTTFILYMIMIPPISFVAYYFISENAFRNLFKLPLIRPIAIEPNEIPKFDYFKRILISFFALAALPVTVLGYMLISSANGNLNVQNPSLQVVIIGIIFIFPLVFVAYLVAKAVRQGLSETSHILDELSKGNFSVVSMPSSGDDFGQQSFHLNRVIQQLNTMYTEIFTLNVGLESKVKERTLELENSLEEVKKLKFQQDGDYFLTHLLLKPLGKNQVKSEIISIDFFLKQKKKFEFKGKEYEIGGDLNIAHNVLLQGKKFSVFVNSDAMGKSMQGAGGALVLGAVFQSIIERTNLSSSTYNQSPERWLKNAFIEMHKIFEGFDGSMLVSLVIGLIEEETGFLYFINAEHPWLILYRDGKACFLENELSYRKLGTKGLNSGIFIKTFRLFPGDTIISGSDGRDDILLYSEQSEATQRQINQDENLILSYVEKANGSLDSIFEILTKNGEITDDLSLIRVFYQGKENDNPNEEVSKSYQTAKKHVELGNVDAAIESLQKQILSQPVTNKRFHKLLAKLHFKRKEYSEAIEHAQVYIESHPYDIGFMELGSVLLRKSGKIDEAIEIAERIRLREPKAVKNTFHLIRLYLEKDNVQRAMELLTEWEILYPEEKDRTKKWKQILGLKFPNLLI
ncbi:SpoIIE-like protein phosphatase domain protein [Leptospira yanagawae serovar Saopaulo str. Sao Paulo = ATCC 700523]|uniref:SpoIIE-like protein phosphatase domain protein n=1 Tax=Leptospira yanagawae serovar Saopaulo str. Sao Paulo = ATCC 700523 TaxID=1249483 RepID=A0A5E8HFC6_9LEPT|nr:PP2C family protein-serine/threonine phosphatase [Leptospira yanagawae]EOQ89388.1 SpoIIE-like protein phosphatase domain protein [Leptospira yanagawae serovar Saopaulo str. Sao Paulo = ATCC 700523]